MAERRLIALGDILGFGNLVLIIRPNWWSTHISNSSPEHSGTRLNAAGGLRHPRPSRNCKKQARVGLEWFSDSVVIFALDDSDEACTSVVETAAWLTFETVIAPVRMRFGLDYGEVLFNRHKGIMIGTPIVIADRLQKAQNWSGGTFTAEAIARIGQTRAMDYVVEYDVPVKSREFATRAALNWTCGIHLGIQFLWSETSPEPPREFELEHPDIVEKWRNTRTFHQQVCRSCSQRMRRGA